MSSETHHVDFINPLIDFNRLLLESIENEDDSNPSPPPSPLLSPISQLEHTLTACLDSLSPLTSPESSPPPSPKSPLSTQGFEDPSLFDPHANRKARQKSTKRKQRARKRAKKRALPDSHIEGRPAARQKHFDSARTLHFDLKTESTPVAKSSHVAANDHSRSRRTYTLEEAVGPNSILGFGLLRWDGRETVRLVDANGRVVVLLAGQPDDDDDWATVNKQASEALESRRHRCRIPKSQRNHRHGAYFTLRCGVSLGGGQQYPMNLSNRRKNKQIIRELNGIKAFHRLSGFASSAMATAAPKLHRYYTAMVDKIHSSDPALKHAFPSSVFSAVAYNFGPQTVCYRHRDFANLPFGWCAVTALGDFDATKGGHLILWDLGLAVEFPPGSTILLPSAILEHSNVKVSNSKRRYSFVQFTAGSLFRWVDNNLMTAASYLASLTSEELQEVKVRNAARWLFGLSLLPICNDPLSKSS